MYKIKSLIAILAAILLIGCAQVMIIGQAALHGVIARIQDIHIPLISVCPKNAVNQVDMYSKDEP